MKKVTIFGSSLLAALAFSTVMLFNACDDDACKDVTCLNGGTCVDGTCDCAAGYEGTDCGIKSSDRYVGSWSGTDVCNSGTYNFTATITASSVSANQILISNFGGFGSSVVVTGTVDGSSLTVAAQTFGNVTISGNGTLTGNDLTLNVTYTADDGTTVDGCTGTWIKQ